MAKLQRKLQREKVNGKNTLDICATLLDCNTFKANYGGKEFHIKWG
jgi:hypothetical protein